jgi:hypothetical protein
VELYLIWRRSIAASPVAAASVTQVTALHPDQNVSDTNCRDWQR